MLICQHFLRGVRRGGLSIGERTTRNVPARITLRTSPKHMLLQKNVISLNSIREIERHRTTFAGLTDKWFSENVKSVHRIGNPSTLHATICPTWFIINLDSCGTESFVPVECKQSYRWFWRPHSSTRAIIRHIRERKHVIEYLVSENINIFISYCLKEKEILDKLLNRHWGAVKCV